MKIIYILPSIKIRGSSIILEHINGLVKKGHDVILTSLDEPNASFPNISPIKLADAKKEFENADAIVGYMPVCAFYVNDIETKARKYCLLLNDERDYYTHEYIKEINKVDGVKLDIEQEKQEKFIEESYKLPLRYIVPNDTLASKMSSKKVSLLEVGIDKEKFYPEQYVPKGSKIRIITDGNKLPWVKTDVISLAISELHGFELWTVGGDKPPFKVDKHWGNLNEEMLRRVLSSSDIYLDVSTIDGTAEMALKAMACGCAVVATMTDGGKMYYKDGDNCIIIKGDTEEEMADSLKTSLNELMTDKTKLEAIVRGGLATDRELQIDNLEKILKRK